MQDTTDVLIELLKQKETIPNSGVAYSDPVLLNYLDQSMKGFIVPAVESTIEEHFVVTIDVQMPPIPSYTGTSPPTNVGNVLTIPSESTGLRLRDIYVIGSDGSPFNLPRLTPTQAASQTWYNPWGPATTISSQNLFIGGFYLQGNTVQIFPYGLASNKLIRMTYQRAPADLCLVSDAAQILAIAGDVVTVNTVQPNWFSGITRVSISSNDAPHDYVTDQSVAVNVYASPAVLNDVTLVTVAGNIIQLPAGMGASVKVGDWLCPVGTSVFAQNIPRQLYPALVQKAAAMCIHSAGDSAGQKIAEGQYDAMIAMALKQIAPRVIGKPVTVIPINSAFRASRGVNYGRF